MHELRLNERVQLEGVRVWGAYDSVLSKSKGLTVRYLAGADTKSAPTTLGRAIT